MHTDFLFLQNVSIQMFFFHMHFESIKLFLHILENCCNDFDNERVEIKSKTNTIWVIEMFNLQMYCIVQNKIQIKQSNIHTCMHLDAFHEFVVCQSYNP